MKLIADSGSTKTDWVFLESEHKTISFNSVGLHPSFNSKNDIRTVLKETFPRDLQPTEIHFYGAGCGSKNNIDKMTECLKEAFPSALKTNVESDLLGASRSLFSSGQGITCILGTGSNSCFYDGQSNHKNFPSLGYILGDEGSGADLGKRFLKANFSGQLPTDIHIEIEKEFGNLETILENLNNGIHPNRYLASFAKIIGIYKKNKEVQSIIQESFEAFIRNQILIYPESKLFPVGFVGSIATHFKDELELALKKYNIKLGSIDPSPIIGLMKFHRL